MYTLETLITLLLIALVIGLIAGTIIAQRIAPSKQSQQDMEKHLEELQQQQSSYQQEVTKHFSETGNLLNQLTQSYRNVHDHLASGAKLLADQQAQESINRLPDYQDAQTVDVEEHTIMPPLDYAPKSTPYEKGMLNEKFGLDTQTQNQTPETDPVHTGTHNHS